MTIKAEQLASTICKLGGEKVSNLELQKIAYLAQIVYVASHEGDKLIGDDFQAWKLGPVIPKLYEKFKTHKSGPIPISDFDDDDMLDLESDEGKFIEEVCKPLLKLSAAKLVNITHKKGGGWETTDLGKNISFESIRYEYEKIHGYKF